jgi:energy-coupling factor transport system ATP-binding protein
MRISVEGISFSYPGGVQALDGIDLIVEGNETLALIGENGAGKSTLAKHLNGLLRPDKGHVLIGDWDTRDYPVAQLARRVGLAFQNPDDQLFARTVAEEVAFGPRNLGRDEVAVRADVEQALARVGLEGVREQHPYDLPVPERKLVALAAVLAMHTPVVVLDEPTMAQDARGVAEMGRIVDELHAEGRTVIAITHDIDFCADHFARVVVLAGGRVMADGPANDVLTQAELLAQSQIEPPQLVRLARAIGLPRAPLTIDGFLQTLTQKE